jgi:protein arginine N-methyltransferase 5
MKAYLTPVDGISIPSSYTAFIAPISSSKLFMEARNREQLKDMETPYVVAIHAFDFLSGHTGGAQGAFGGKVQECWEFEHPRKDALSEGEVADYFVLRKS